MDRWQLVLIFGGIFFYTFVLLLEHDPKLIIFYSYLFLILVASAGIREIIKKLNG